MSRRMFRVNGIRHKLSPSRKRIVIPMSLLDRVLDYDVQFAQICTPRCFFKSAIGWVDFNRAGFEAVSGLWYLAKRGQDCLRAC